MKKLLITVNGKRYEVDVEIVQDDDQAEPQQSFRSPARTVESAGAPPAPQVSPPRGKPPAGDSQILTSPISGVVLEIPVKEGDVVKENDILLVLEAMKMKTNISSPQNGKIKTINVKTGDKIEAGQPLLAFA
jgi:biotin carboxyl carrier protein